MFLSLSAAYYLCAKISLLFAGSQFNLSPVWPAAGIALAALFLGGKKLWPAIVLGSMAADLTANISFLPAVINASAGAVEALVGATLLARLFDFRPDMRRRRDAYSLAAASALASLLGAAIGVGALVMSELVPASHIWANYRLWWFADTVGSFLVAPVVFLAFMAFCWTWRNCVEIVAALLATGLITFISLTYMADRFPFVLILVTIILIALRLRHVGVASSSVAVCAVSMWAVLSGAGNPAGLPAAEAAITLQAATVAVAAAGLLIAILLIERDAERAFIDGVLEDLDAGIVACDAAGTLTLFNRATREFHKLPAEPIPSQEWARHYDLFHADGVTLLQREEIPLLRALGGEQVRDAVIVIAPKDGEPRTVMVNGHSLRGEAGDLLGAVVAVHDVTALRKAEQEVLNRQALHDSLTDLPNRLLLRDRLERALLGRARPDGSVALVVLDLDDFKTVNDSLGHDVGDRVLTTVAERLRSSVRPEDTVARLGGDQFALILENLSKERATLVAGEIETVIRAPIQVQERTVSITASIGIAVNAHGNSGEDLLRNADLAMHEAQSNGGLQVFEPAMHKAVLKRLNLDSDLREAIAGQQLTLHYQPIVSLVTGNLTGFESLLRWNHPERGAISPSEFIPVAEATGLIVPLGEWALRTACHQARRWQDAYPDTRHLAMHVNLSVSQLREDSIDEVVGAILAESGLPAGLLVLEITESVVMHRGKALDALDRLHEAGIQLAIDDFGTGYSSLSRLQALPIDKVKIDKSFIDGVCEASTTPMVAATIAMAHSLGLQTVAEGVEKPEQLPILRLHGCDEIQGYLFGRPSDVDTIEGMFLDPKTRSMALPQPLGRHARDGVPISGRSD